MADRKNGKNQLVDTHSFRTEGLCQEYLIEETQKSAQQIRKGQDQSPFDKLSR